MLQRKALSFSFKTGKRRPVFQVVPDSEGAKLALLRERESSIMFYLFMTESCWSLVSPC